MNERQRQSSFLFSPLTFPAFFLLSFALYALGLTKNIGRASFDTIAYVAVSMVVYVIAAIAGRAVARRRSGATLCSATVNSSSQSLWYLYAISLMLYVLEHAVFISRYGSPPIFRADFETLRFSFPLNGYVHLLASMNYIFLFGIAVDRMFSKRSGKSGIVPIIVACIMSASLDILVGNRAATIGLVAMILIAASFRYRFAIRAIVAGVGLVFLFGWAKLYRDYALYGDAVYATVRGNWDLGDGVIMSSLYFLYTGVAENFKILNLYVQSGIQPKLGYFTILTPLYSLMPGHQYGLLDLQSDVLGVRFHGILTGTFLTIPYVDFWIFGALVCAPIGMIAGYLYEMAAKTKSTRYVAAYGYYHWCVLLSIYTYMFDKLYVLINIAFLLLYFSRSPFRHFKRAAKSAVAKG